MLLTGWANDQKKPTVRTDRQRAKRGFIMDGNPSYLEVRIIRGAREEIAALRYPQRWAICRSARARSPPGDRNWDQE